MVEASIHSLLVAVYTNRFHVFFTSAIEQLTVDPSEAVVCPDGEALEEDPVIAVVRSNDEALEAKTTSEFVFDTSGVEDPDASVAIVVKEPEPNEPESGDGEPVLNEPAFSDSESVLNEPAFSEPVLNESGFNEPTFNEPPFNGSELNEPALINSALLK